MWQLQSETTPSIRMKHGLSSAAFLRIGSWDTLSSRSNTWQFFPSRIRTFVEKYTCLRAPSLDVSSLEWTDTYGGSRIDDYWASGPLSMTINSSLFSFFFLLFFLAYGLSFPSHQLLRSILSRTHGKMCHPAGMGRMTRVGCHGKESIAATRGSLLCEFCCYFLGNLLLRVNYKICYPDFISVPSYARFSMACSC